MANEFVGKGAVGVRIRVTMGIDVTGGPVQVRYKKPDGTTGTWTGVIEDAAEGIIYYDTISGDLSQSGVYYINGVYDPAGDNVFYGAGACFTVSELGQCD